MYLVTWCENSAKIEASLGGRVTAEEMLVFAEEIKTVLDTLDQQPYLLMLDYSRAKSFDMKATDVLISLKDFCLSTGAEKIVTVVRDEEDMAYHTHARIQNVLEGTEQFALLPESAVWPEIQYAAVASPLKKAA